MNKNIVVCGMIIVATLYFAGCGTTNEDVVSETTALYLNETMEGKEEKARIMDTPADEKELLLAESENIASNKSTVNTDANEKNDKEAIKFIGNENGNKKEPLTEDVGPSKKAEKENQSTNAKPDTIKTSDAEPTLHEHKWIEVTKTIHHDPQYETIHHEAVYDSRTRTVHHDAQYNTIHHDPEYAEEQVWVEDVPEEYEWNQKAVCICSTCGIDITNVDDDEHADECEYDGYYIDYIDICTYHEAQGHYETKQTVVKEAWDEQVLISEAWDEQVSETVLVCGPWDEQIEIAGAWDENIVTAYRCEGCGTIK